MSDKWTAAEELLIWAAVAECRSNNVYRHTCYTLCEMLGRSPGMGETQTDPVREAVDLIERRTVTAGSAKSRLNPDLTPLAVTVFRGRRAGTPLTWAEKVKLLQPHHRHGLTRGEHRTLEEICLYTDRPAADPAPRAYLNRLQGLRASKADLEDPAGTRVFPSGPVTVGVVRDAVVRPWVESPSGETWEAVLDYLEFGRVPQVPEPLVPAVSEPSPLFYPDVYVPSALRPPAPPPRDEITFAVGVETDPGTFGMIGGPWPALADALEFVPGPENWLHGRPVRVVRFNRDGTDEVIYTWAADRLPNGWVRTQPSSPGT